MRKDPNHKAWSHTPHDHSYKRLFAHPQMMTDLLLGFAPKALLTHLQLNTLELINKSFVSDDLRTRESDLIWRVRLADHWLYVYLLLEFQSTIDPMMAVRIMGYLALLYQDLEKQQRKTTPVENGKTAPKHLPPVLPIVIYSGEKPWNAALNVRNLLDPHTPKSLHRFCPETHYLLLDQGAIIRHPHYSSSLQNCVQALFELEQVNSEAELKAKGLAFLEVLKREADQQLKQDFALWFKHSFLLRKSRSLGLQWEEEYLQTDDFYGVYDMLADKVDRWNQALIDQGRHEGRQAGREEGREEGVEIGLHQGKKELLQKLMVLKFGEIPAWAHARLETARLDELEHWAESILTVGHVDDLFKV